MVLVVKICQKEEKKLKTAKFVGMISFEVEN